MAVGDRRECRDTQSAALVPAERVGRGELVSGIQRSERKVPLHKEKISGVKVQV
jgi:hypothetical protein